MITDGPDPLIVEETKFVDLDSFTLDKLSEFQSSFIFSFRLRIKDIG